jgi:hypothetical protein
MYHKPSKRVIFFRRIIVLTIMWIAVSAGVIVLFALTLGYSFNQKSGHIEQGGILQMSSQPGGATIFLNDQQFSSQTPTKFVAQPGTVSVKMQKSGYHDWQKQVPIQPGNITWAAYPRLIPQKPTPTSALTLPSSLSGGLSSPGNNYYAFAPKADESQFTIADISSDTVQTKSVTLPSSVVTQPPEGTPQSYEVTLWSGDEKSLLIKHTYGDTAEWIVLPLAEPDKATNLTTFFGLRSSKVVFASSDGRKLFEQDGDSVRLMNLEDQTVSRPYVSGVSDFRLYDGETVLYSSQPKDGVQQIGYVKKDFKSPIVLVSHTYDGTHLVKFDMSKYYDTYNILVGAGTEAILYTTKSLPTSLAEVNKFSPTRLLSLISPRPLTSLNLTENGQFATIQDGSSLVTHNLEIKKTTSVVVGSVDQPQEFKYLDTYLLWGMRAGQLRTVEFDGENQHDIMPVDPRFDVSLSRSGKYLYGVAKKADGAYELRRVQLLDIPT